MVDFITHLRAESARFESVLRSGDLSAPVPSCPAWTLADLGWHLAEVQHFWGSIVEGLITDPEQVPDIERPDDSGLADVSAVQSLRLVSALTERSPGDRCWTWDDAGWTVGWVARRQAHEAAIHRYDAELAAGGVTPLDPELAADGVDEILRVMIGGVPDWAAFEPTGESLRIASTDPGRTWGVAFGTISGVSPRSGRAVDLDGATIGVDATSPAAVVSGGANDLDLWLWGRVGLDGITVAGDRALVARLRSLATKSTQ